MRTWRLRSELMETTKRYRLSCGRKEHLVEYLIVYNQALYPYHDRPGLSRQSVARGRSVLRSYFGRVAEQILPTRRPSTAPGSSCSRTSTACGREASCSTPTWRREPWFGGETEADEGMKQRQTGSLRKKNVRRITTCMREINHDALSE